MITNPMHVITGSIQGKQEMPGKGDKGPWYKFGVRAVYTATSGKTLERTIPGLAAFGRNAEAVAGLNDGDPVTVTFMLGGREANGYTFTDFKVERIEAGARVSAPAAPASNGLEFPAEPVPAAADDESGWF